MTEIGSYKLASTAAKIIDDKLGKEIAILDISNVSVISDYFVICSAETTTQVRALSGYIKELIKKLYGRYPQSENIDSKNRWNLLDYGDVVVHIMHKEERMYYAIEKFWSHACKVSEEEWREESKSINLEGL